MDSNYWYYTLSAIPQTLAAMIALAATFSVFKLDHVSERINEVRIDLRRFMLLLGSNLQKEIHDIEQLGNKEFFELYEQLLNDLNTEDQFLGLGETMFGKLEKELFRKISSDWHSYYRAKPFRITGYLKMRKDMLKSLILSQRESLSYLLWSLVLAVLIISISLIMLPNYDYFSGSRVVVYSMTVGSVVSLIVTAISVWKISRL